MSMDNKEYDLVLISDAKTESLRKLTLNAIESAGNKGNIVVVESNPHVDYQNVQTIHPNIKFGYNAFLNIGARQGKSNFIFFGNNDLHFEAGWDEALMTAMLKYNVKSASPFCPVSHVKLNIQKDSGVYFGTEIFSRFCGWAFMWTRQLYETVGSFDEDFVFWCSDNATVEQLLRLHQSHILVTTSIVRHLQEGNNTINELDRKSVHEYTVKEIEKFNMKYKRNLRIDPTWLLPKGISNASAE